MGADVAEFREVTFCAQARYLRAICSELDFHSGPEVIPSSPWEARVPQMAPQSPKEAKGYQNDAKEGPLGAQGAPKASKREPKVAPRRTK